jgi:large subunit ribosomal protein L3
MALGLIGKKLGMTQVYTPAGVLVPVTVIETGPCTIVQAKTVTTDGYAAVQVGFGAKKPQRATKAVREHCVKAGKGVFQVLREFRLDEGDAALSPGDEISLDGLFKQGDKVDVTGVTKGRGFTGVVKRHGFSGFPASHGTHEYFRHGGSIGNRSFPGRVFKNKRMAGQYGNDRITTQNIEVVAVRPAERLLLVRGAVPGARGGVVVVRLAIKAWAKAGK